MSQTSVVAHRAVLDATALRFRRIFGEAAVRAESTRNESVRTESARTDGAGEAVRSQEFMSPKLRHESKRSLLEPRTPVELLRSNSPDAVNQRLRKLGFPEQVIRGVTDHGPLLEGRFDTARIGLERLIGRNELLAIRYLDGGQRAGRAVARVVVRSSSGSVLGYGTGSLISPTLLMTNNHVLGSAGEARNSIVEFNYQLGLKGSELPRATYRLRPDLFFATSPEAELDFTIVAVSTEPLATGGRGLTEFGFNPLTATTGEILAGESVTIIQHPGGDLKQIALRENRVLRFPNTGDEFLYYETDTTPGSSGAPVFNDQWEVIALHHSGFPERDSRGNLLTPDGQIWREEMGDDRIHWIANEGIRVVAIREFLSRMQALSSAQGNLRDGVLNPVRPSQADEGQQITGHQVTPVVPQPVSQAPVSRAPASGAGVVSQQSSGDGMTAVWNIPLTISVSMGLPGMAGPTAAVIASQVSNQGGVTSGGSALASTPAACDGTALTGGMAAVNSHSGGPTGDHFTDDDFAEARRTLAEAATRPYYDSTADEAARASYYAGISTTLSSTQLFDALTTLLTQTHRNQLDYQPSKHLYPWVDLQPGTLKIKSIYSNQVSSPLEFIERDAEIARLRRERMSRFLVSESATSPLAEAVFLESLESQLPFNCEHVVPQSWFQKRLPMKGDLHHLFACETTCNSFRSNTPYFDFADFRESIRSDCGKSETNKFEPNGGKGAVARATLYFLLRYPGKINATANEYTADRLQVLLKWHRDFPVTEYERHRNQAIFQAQGNRNPLIDIPTLADHIDFSRGLG